MFHIQFHDLWHGIVWHRQMCQHHHSMAIHNWNVYYTVMSIGIWFNCLLSWKLFFFFAIKIDSNILRILIIELIFTIFAMYINNVFFKSQYHCEEETVTLTCTSQDTVFSKDSESAGIVIRFEVEKLDFVSSSNIVTGATLLSGSFCKLSISAQMHLTSLNNYGQ